MTTPTTAELQARVAELERELKTTRVAPNAMPRPIRTAATFELECICGKSIVTTDVACVCPKCGRQVQVAWPAIRPVVS